MALDLHLRSAQGHRQHNARHKTVNGRVILQADPIGNEGIAHYIQARKRRPCRQRLGEISRRCLSAGRQGNPRATPPMSSNTIIHMCRLRRDNDLYFNSNTDPKRCPINRGLYARRSRSQSGSNRRENHSPDCAELHSLRQALGITLQL